MAAENAAKARRWFQEVWNERRPEVVHEMLADEGVCHAEHGPVRGKAEFLERVYAPFVSAIPDLYLEVQGVVADGDQAAVRWVARGTHSGEGLGIPPTGQPIEVHGMTWMRFRDGLLAEGWDLWNFRGTMDTLQAAATAAGLA